MAVKLGELLIREKMITAAQLEEALKNQVIFGIRLGSSLVEMGYVDEEALAQLLSAKLGVPCVTRKELASASRDAISCISRELASKCHVVPFRVEKNRLSIAMSDPTDFKSIEEIGFITGRLVKPFIAPDVLISKALAKFYAISSPEMRYQQMAQKRPKATVVENEQQTITMPGFSETGELLNMTIPLEFEGFAGYLGDEPDDLYQLPDQAVRYTVDRLSTDFASARTRDDVADVFINYLGQEFTICALFIVRGNGAVGWRAIRNGEKIQGFDELNLLLSKPSVIRDMVENRQFSMGPLINTPENCLILQKLGARSDSPLLALPVVMLHKVVAVVLVSADMDALGKRLQDLQKLVRKASLAFEMLIIRNKILMT